jgi:predicted ABC-type ATPase
MFVLAGPNGAGKSTLYQTVIAPKIDAPFINADHSESGAHFVIQKADQDQSSLHCTFCNQQRINLFSLPTLSSR